MLSLFLVGTTKASETTEEETTQTTTSKLPGKHIFHIICCSSSLFEIL